MMQARMPAVGWFRNVGEVIDSAASPNMEAMSPAIKAELPGERVPER